MAQVDKLKEIEKILVQICLKIARQGKGCIFVIKLKDLKYTLLMPQDLKMFNILEEKNHRRLEILALQDGACIISPEGDLIAYSAKISNTKPFTGFGTKHSAGYSASLNGNISILASEEDGKVRMFENGKMMQLDPLEKGIDKNVSKAFDIFKSIGVGTVGVAAMGAASTLVPSMAPYILIPAVPGLIVFTSVHAAVNYFKDNPENKMERRKKIIKFILGSILIIAGVAIIAIPVNLWHIWVGAAISIIGLFIAFTTRSRKEEEKI